MDVLVFSGGSLTPMQICLSILMWLPEVPSKDL